jgi:hypothetical protein
VADHLNNPLTGVAARDRASMKGTSQGDRVAALEARIAQLERALAYQTQLPREIVIISGETYTPVPFDGDGRLYMRSAEDPTVSSIDIGRRPHARQHVIDLVVNIDWIKARLLEDLVFLGNICAYCDPGTVPPPWPGG